MRAHADFRGVGAFGIDTAPQKQMASSPPRLRRRPLPDVPLRDCSAVKTLAIIGERWTLLVLREAFYGVTRFDDMQVQLAVSRKTLTEQLIKLVKAGLLERTPYTDDVGRTRLEYRLTIKGLDLTTLFLALMEWGDRHLPGLRGRPLAFVDPKTNLQVKARLILEDGRVLSGPLDLKRIAWPDRKAKDV